MRSQRGLFVALALACGAAGARTAEQIFEPLETGRPRPADFDAYWDGEIARQRREAPLSVAAVRVVEVPSRVKGFRVYDVEIPTLEGRPAKGLLTVPSDAAARSLPIIVTTAGAGSKSACEDCYERAIGFGINAYGVDNRQPDAYYEALFRTELKDYPHQGWERRETCWFRGQILRLVRALEWVKTRPEWNGRDLIVQGRSMGGSQALQAGALDRDVTVCAPYDPALCDHAGEKARQPRLAGWPQIRAWAVGRKLPSETIARIEETADYFDNCHFAARITCQAYFSSGYRDRCCPSEGVFIAYQNARGGKILVTNPSATHCMTQNAPFDELVLRLCGRRLRAPNTGAGTAGPQSATNAAPRASR